jgi:hypothetical protein
MYANRLAFRQWKLIPRMLRSPTDRDLEVCSGIGIQTPLAEHSAPASKKSLNLVERSQDSPKPTDLQHTDITISLSKARKRQRMQRPVLILNTRVLA